MSESDSKNPVWTGRHGPLTSRLSCGIMAIVNLTPDSFFDGGRHNSPAAGLAFADKALADGADILDLGGESTRPGSARVAASEEIARILPVLDALMQRKDSPCVSIDTWRAETAAVALEHGATVINDVSACSMDPGLTDVLVTYKPGYVLMHSQGRPETMQQAPRYDDVLSEVTAFFEREMNRLVRAGFPEDHIILDPGIGFGKKAAHNLRLMAHPEAWQHLGRPSLMALSMKSVFGEVPGLPVDDRSTITQVATALTLEKGYTWHRVHETARTAQTIALAAALAADTPQNPAVSPSASASGLPGDTRD